MGWKLKNRMDSWILITGASSGIGRITAEYLASCGYNLILVSRSHNRLLEVAKDVKSKKSIICPMDLCELSKIKSIFDLCKTNGIKLTGMVHCAGIGPIIPVKNNDINSMQATMTTNYFSFVELCKYFGQKKYSEDNASIVAVSSISPLTCYPGSCNYAASKSAINTAVKVISREYLRRKIRVNAVLPGYVNTPMGPDENDFSYIEQQPFGIIQAQYISYMIEFLLSDKAKYITGSLIPISGGMDF